MTNNLLLDLDDDCDDHDDNIDDEDDDLNNVILAFPNAIRKPKRKEAPSEEFTWDNAAIESCWNHCLDTHDMAGVEDDNDIVNVEDGDEGDNQKKRKINTTKTIIITPWKVPSSLGNGDGDTANNDYTKWEPTSSSLSLPSWGVVHPLEEPNYNNLQPDDP